MKILVFGSNGLVGNSLRRVFNDSDAEIFFSTRNDTDLFLFTDTSKIINEFKPDIVINAAAKVGGIHANNTQRTTFLLQNTKINLNILESCIPFNNIKIINLGSSCIYPLDAENPISEKSVMTGPLEPTNSPYAMAKLTALELGNSLRAEYGHEVINLMPTNLYGPNDNFSAKTSHVIPGLIRRMHQSKMKKENNFLIWGSGTPLREFLFVDDLASAIQFIIQNGIDDTLINIGSSKEITILDLANKIKHIIGFKGDLNFDSTMPDGNPRKLLDSSLINNHGWLPKISLDEGLKLSYDWFLQNES